MAVHGTPAELSQQGVLSAVPVVSGASANQPVQLVYYNMLQVPPPSPSRSAHCAPVCPAAGDAGLRGARPRHRPLQPGHLSSAGAPGANGGADLPDAVRGGASRQPAAQAAATQPAACDHPASSAALPGSVRITGGGPEHSVQEHCLAMSVGAGGSSRFSWRAALIR